MVTLVFSKKQKMKKQQERDRNSKLRSAGCSLSLSIFVHCSLFIVVRRTETWKGKLSSAETDEHCLITQGHPISAQLEECAELLQLRVLVGRAGHLRDAVPRGPCFGHSSKQLRFVFIRRLCVIGCGTGRAICYEPRRPRHHKSLRVGILSWLSTWQSQESELWQDQRFSDVHHGPLFVSFSLSLFLSFSLSPFLSLSPSLCLFLSFSPSVFLSVFPSLLLSLFHDHEQWQLMITCDSVSQFTISYHKLWQLMITYRDLWYRMFSYHMLTKNI